MLRTCVTRSCNAARLIWRAFYQGIFVHDGVEHAGYLAFLSLLSLFPFLVLVVTVAGWLGQGALGARFIELLFQSLPGGAVVALRPRVDEIVAGPPQGFIGAAILGAIWTASSMVEGMRTILNRAYRVETPPAYWLRRLLSVGQLLVFLAIVLVVTTVILAAPLLVNFVLSILHLPALPHEGFWWNTLLFAGSALVLFLIVANLYYVVPNVRQSFRSVAPGAAVVVVLWLSAAWLFSQYLANFHQVNLIYGSLGGFIATLLFFYLSGLIFIFGAELNAEIKLAHGERLIAREAAQITPSGETANG